MKAFLLAMVALVVVALGAGYGLDGIYGQSAEEKFVSDNVRLQ